MPAPALHPPAGRARALPAALLAGLLALGLAAGAGPAAPEGGPARLTVRLDLPGVAVSPLLYGIFFEEINHAGDGGLYAELVRNRSFEDAATSEAWTAYGEGSIALDQTRPLNPKNPTSLRLEIRGTGGAGAANGGFWGIPVRKGASYRLSFFARRSSDFRGPIAVSLQDASGRSLAAARIGGVGEEWRRFECRLRAEDSSPAARLSLGAGAPGTVWLDVVSLFPVETWKRRRNGLRPDLVRLLLEMRPAFVRFPGGCFCEGERLADAFRWKNSIGPIEERPGHWNLWGYRSSDGLGYHEYLQLCEDLGAEPLFVVNCGMAHREVAPMERLDEWVQDALDAIEYANGPVTSRWGALRARNGHPAPFGLKYLEIGNENGWGNTLPLYEERYARFHDAIRARYPDVRLVANVPVRSRPADLIDDHFYNSPDWFLTNAGRYDRYDRKAPKVYVGEYAVTQGCGQGNLIAALAEAAFMTGFERNADVISMASYAPLFVNVNDRRWNPDAIVFNGTSSFGTPSYHVQALFAKHRPDFAFPSELSQPREGAVRPGAVGLGTWRTRAEYRDLRVTRGSETLLAPAFDGAAPGWRIVRGSWRAEGGSFIQSADGTDLRAVAGDPAWTDYTLSLRARKLSGAEGFLIMFRVRSDGDWYWWNLGGWNNTVHAVERSAAGAKSIISPEVPGRIETGRWYDVRIELEGPRIRCYLDGRLIHDFEDQAAPLLAASCGRTRSGEIVLKVVNAGAEPREIEVELQGAGEVAPDARAVLLSGSGPNVENSFDGPLRIAPREETATGLGRRFRRSFPAHSLTILRLRERR